MKLFKFFLTSVSKKIQGVDTALLNKSADIIRQVSLKGAKVIIVGNGCSAAIASHVSVDLTENAKIRTINFNEADLITCFANDYAYNRWIEKALEFYAEKGDVCILISSSGKSRNIINAALKAKDMALKVIIFSGFNMDNPLRELRYKFLR